MKVPPKISGIWLKCWFRKLPLYFQKFANKKRQVPKNRKINLTFGVFRVIPSYLVRREHILWKNNKKIIFDEKIFFRSKKSKFRKKYFSTFWDFAKYRNKIWDFENSKNLRCWKFDILKFRFRYFPKSQNFEKIFFRNFDFWIEKIFFHQKIFFYIL